MLDAPAMTRDGRAERYAPRAAGALLLLAAAIIHFADLGGVGIRYLYVGFVLSGVGMVAGAALLLYRAPRLGWLLGGGTAALTALGLVLSKTVGLPQLGSEVGKWTKPPEGLWSAVLEAVAALLALWALTDRYGLRPAADELRAITPGSTTHGTRDGTDRRLDGRP
jgi:hypothetical protein